MWPQRIEVRASRFNGKIEVWRYCSQVSLRVDGLTQSGGLMEEIWGKTMKIVYSQQLSVNRILILGLGGGTAAKVVKQYWPQVKITGVDIDPVMIELGEKYLGLAGVTKIIADAVEWVAKSKQKFDGILVDVYQGRRIPKSVTSKAFLESLSQKGRWVIFNRLKFKGQNNEGFKIRLRRIWGQVEIIKTPANELLLVK
ncbi:MAG: hypothetical protein A2784_04485 [Candidatus Chisholmbacteria bacterium RIFCSPHIGHO2_01_FULL_48_12]|uniref:PABS domain-containing protein n=1 Tax=Candidatus Chisholmbacteria bacterium RIFCSPHIGHO2_01_FULL_48_12 TaxID=1797589 RepID=A0A1G1VK27_9BACT|nr:MAG: hypothetical protein A2784_04485 [Candidatus Chisholmbacteria bacterium RIFCSPHIGHO2_01_FULL_48_12]